MCFSANASFTAAAGLSVLGLLSVHAAKKNRSLRALASCPLFFAIQQGCEGIVWITLNNGDTTSLLHLIATYGFMSFAGIFWPIWVPLALYIPEKLHRRKKLLFMIMCIGACSAVLLFFSWILPTSGAKAIQHHIDYPVTNYPFGITHPLLKKLVVWISSLSYCIAVMAPFFVSSIAYMWMAGVVIVLAFVASYIFYYATLGSVWCFFAAIASGLMYVLIKKESNKS